MKSKNGEFAVAILITVVVIILGGLFVVWQMGFFKGKKQDLDTTNGKIDSAIGSIADFDLIVYDGSTMKGDALIELISDFKNKDMKVSVWVKTLDSTDSYYNYAYTSSNLGAAVTITPPPSKATAGYITSTANFLGEVVKNTNNEIVCLKFIQQK